MWWEFSEKTENKSIKWDLTMTTLTFCRLYGTCIVWDMQNAAFEYRQFPKLTVFLNVCSLVRIDQVIMVDRVSICSRCQTRWRDAWKKLQGMSRYIIWPQDNVHNAANTIRLYAAIHNALVKCLLEMFSLFWGQDQIVKTHAFEMNYASVRINYNTSNNASRPSMHIREYCITELLLRAL